MNYAYIIEFGNDFPYVKNKNYNFLLAFKYNNMLFNERIVVGLKISNEKSI